MLRWLKVKRGSKKNEATEALKCKGIHPSDSDYGFNDDVYHIYEEIPDLPVKLCEECQRNTSTDSETVVSDDNDIDSGVDAEPYLISCIVDQIDLKSSRLSDKRSRIADNKPSVLTKNNIKTQFKVQRTQGSVAKQPSCKPTLPPRNTQTTKQLSIDFSGNRATNCIMKSNAVAENDCVKTDLLNNSIKETRVQNSGMYIDNFTEDDSQEEYKRQLSRVSRNLNLKQDIHRLIASVENTLTTNCPSNTNDECMFDDIISLSNLSHSSSVASLTNESDISERGAFADISESDDSGTYSTCTSERLCQSYATGSMSKFVGTESYKIRPSCGVLNPEVIDVRSTKGDNCKRNGDKYTLKSNVYFSNDNDIYGINYHSNNRLLSDMMKRNYDRQLLMI